MNWSFNVMGEKKRGGVDEGKRNCPRIKIRDIATKCYVSAVKYFFFFFKGVGRMK